jgi:hypothetical protein
VTLQTLQVGDFLVTTSVLCLHLNVVFRTTSTLELASFGESAIKRRCKWLNNSESDGIESSLPVAIITGATLILGDHSVVAAGSS